MTGVDWSRLLDSLDEPPLGTVAEALADATDTPVSAAYDRVVDAFEAGELVERDRGAAFGVAGRPDGPLVNIDVDDGEATTPGDFPATLPARSRSRGESWHRCGFNPAGDIPNLPTDDLGEIRTDWQYVVAPGSFVASMAEEIPDGTDDPRVLHDRGGRAGRDHRIR